MKKRFSEEQIIKILQEHKEGKSISEICREHLRIRFTFGSGSMETSSSTK